MQWLFNVIDTGYATPEHLLKYVVEIYNDSSYNHQAVAEGMCNTIICDMYSIFRQPYEAVVHQLQEYVAALDDCSVPDDDSAAQYPIACTCSVSSIDGSLDSDRAASV